MDAPRICSAAHFEEHARAYLAWSRRHHTASTHRTRRSLVESHLIPHFGRFRLCELSRADIERVLAAQVHLSPASCNRILSALSAVLAHAQRLGAIQHNAAASIARARETVTPLPLVSSSSQQRLIESLPAPRRLLFLLALDSGMRLGEILALGWRDVDWERGALLIRRTKSHRPRLVRMTRRVQRALRAAATKALAGPRVFEAAIGADGALRWAWRRSFKRAAAGIGQPDLRIHDLRHLAAINLVRAGVDLPTVQAHLGHRHLASTLRYAAYADETASARAARVLDRLHGEDEDRPVR